MTLNGSLLRGSWIEPTALTVIWRPVLFLTCVTSGLDLQSTFTETAGAASATDGPPPA